MRIVAALLLALSVVPSHAADWPFLVSPPVVLRLDGAFAPSRDLARLRGADPLEVRIDEDLRWFRADRARTLTASAPLGRDVLAALAPLHPNLRILGPRAQLTALAQAADGVAITLEGVVDTSVGTYLLRSFTIAAP